jgi:N-acetylglucosaminyldiphosphoundecaprenol N-acetyl-beta-D-mannosaminyltransferase
MSLLDFKLFTESLDTINLQRALITTINAYSYNISRKDTVFCDALMKSDILIPDGIGIVWAIRWLTGKKIEKIAGADLFKYEMERMQKKKGSVFFLGSSESTLTKIKNRVKQDYPDVAVEIYSPPFKSEFFKDENEKMISAINAFHPDVLFIDMTVPKQEKWASKHYDALQAGHICCIGAVFDFYAGNIKRAPKWMIDLGVEWLYRLIREPFRMVHRNLDSIFFVYKILSEKSQLRYQRSLYQDLIHQRIH